MTHRSLRPWGAKTLGLILLLAGGNLLGPTVAEGQTASVQQAQITVSAEGRVTATPDIATITLGVQHDGDTASDAVAGMARAAEAVLAAIAAAGVESRDVQTSGLSLTPRYARYDSSRDEPPKILGYSAETTVLVRVRALDDLGGILDTVVEEGANLFRGLSFGLAEPGPLQDEARRRAVREATRQAELLAEAAGVTLGPLIRLDAQGLAPRPEMMRSARMDMAESPSIPIAEGEVALTARVSLVYALEQP